ncbi:MFS transporter [Mumia sp. zg.B53]|uniref:MFS transporter n=1 Tax=Mumia sp. zg.B53 TaxID=2855449 RepID=UPI00210857ED|nr:MFS transporter [Mumia sp. zg.B53]
MHERVPTEHTAAQPSRSRARARDAPMLAVLCGAIFLEGIDLSMTAVALPSIRADLDMSTTGLQWVVSAYALGYGGFVLLGGRASDVLGRRRTFLTWLVVFLLFSGLGGVAVDGWMLVVSRFVTGVAAGFLTPAGLALVTTTFAEGPRRDRALLIYSGAAAGGFSLGMMVGGLLTAIDWRWVFFAPVIMSAVLFAGAVALVPRDERGDGSARERFDVRGTLALTSAMLLVVLALVQSPQAPALRTVVVGVLGLALLGLFVALERRAPAPVVRLGILRSGRLVRANLAALLLVGAFVGFQFVMVLYLQELRGWSEVKTGMAMAVLGLDAVLAPTITPLLVARWGNTVVFLSGFVVAAVAYASLLRLGADLVIRGTAALLRPGEHRVRADVRAAHDRGDERGRCARAGPCRRVAVDVLPVRVGVGARRGRGGPGCRVRSRGDDRARRLPGRAARPGGDRAPRGRGERGDPASGVGPATGLRRSGVRLGVCRGPLVPYAGGG